MNADRWRQVNELFHAALQRDPAERETLLKITAETDPELAREVQSLLERHERAEGFLDVPAWGVAADLILDKESSLVGKQLGSYLVLEEIGRGGMGVVLRAFDEQPHATSGWTVSSPSKRCRQSTPLIAVSGIVSHERRVRPPRSRTRRLRRSLRSKRSTVSCTSRRSWFEARRCAGSWRPDRSRTTGSLTHSSRSPRDSRPHTGATSSIAI